MPLDCAPATGITCQQRKMGNPGKSHGALKSYGRFQRNLRRLNLPELPAPANSENKSVRHRVIGFTLACMALRVSHSQAVPALSAESAFVRLRGAERPGPRMRRQTPIMGTRSPRRREFDCYGAAPVTASRVVAKAAGVPPFDFGRRDYKVDICCCPPYILWNEGGRNAQAPVHEND